MDRYPAQQGCRGSGSTIGRLKDAGPEPPWNTRDRSLSCGRDRRISAASAADCHRGESPMDRTRGFCAGAPVPQWRPNGNNHLGAPCPNGFFLRAPASLGQTLLPQWCPDEFRPLGRPLAGTCRVVDAEPRSRFALDWILVILLVEHAVLDPRPNDLAALRFGFTGAVALDDNPCRSVGGG